MIVCGCVNKVSPEYTKHNEYVTTNINSFATMSIWMKQLKYKPPRTGAVIRLVGADGCCPHSPSPTGGASQQDRVPHVKINSPVYISAGV